MPLSLPPLHRYLPLIIGQSFGTQQLERRPEPSAVTADADHVEQYDRVMTTKLAVAYAVGLEVIYRTRRVPKHGSALDLACGPGHFSLCLAKYLELDSLVGVDLSQRMVKVAGKNARAQGLTQASFAVADVTDLADYPDGSLDLTTFTDAAHHMPNLDAVRRVIEEADRVTHPDGLVAVMDLARLRTASLTESYVKLVGGDYHERGLDAFYEDFHNSMYAAWTTAELATAVPEATNRHWYQLAPLGLPTIQFLLGVPATERKPFVRRGVPWGSENHPLGKALRSDWRAMRQTLCLSRSTRLLPATQ